MHRLIAALGYIQTGSAAWNHLELILVLHGTVWKQSSMDPSLSLHTSQEAHQAGA